MTIWQIKPPQKGPLAMGDPARPSPKDQYEASGKTDPGPIRLGAVFRATMTAVDPMTSEGEERYISFRFEEDRRERERAGLTLSESESSTDVKSRERLQEDHSESDSLDRVEHSEP